MRVILAIVSVYFLTEGARAQSQGPFATPNPPPSDRTFTPDWAKPYPSQGGHIYDDPRLRKERRVDPAQPNRPCPGGTMFDPVNRTCR